MRILQKVKSAAIAAALGVAMLGAAQAAPITGGIDITGKVTEADFDGTSATVEYGSVEVVSGAFGSFSALNGSTPTMVDFVGKTAAQLVGQTIWQSAIDNFSFVVSSVVSLSGNSNIVVLQAIGTVFSNTYDPTTASLILTANDLGASGSFSSSTVVPLPASLLLLGSGVVGFGLVARRRKDKGASNAELAA